jgi:GDP-4-dehydro-6-deoxy-D-mannose reductase
VGSSEEYGLVSAADLPIDEDTVLQPLSSYALSKVTQDLMGLQYYLTHKLPVVRVRPFNHIGPRQRQGFVVPDFASQIAAVEAGRQAPVLQVGNLAARRDFSDVRDVVRAYVLLMKSGQPGQVYNVGSGASHSVQEILDGLLGLAKVPIKVQQDPERLRPAEVPDIVCNASRIREQTGWQATVPFEQSLRDVLDDWRAEFARRP